MGRRIFHFFTCFHMVALLLSPGSSSKLTEQRKFEESVTISTRQMDITTPITTVPTANDPTTTTTTTTTPMLNPTESNPDQSPTVMNPANPQMTTPLATNSPTPTSGSWCIASSSVSQAALQLALDYACGHGADCSPIQKGGACYSPTTLRAHASYAFNSYFQMNPIPTSCNFGGTAVTTSTNPSYDACQYQSTSTSSSLLNITNSSGSRVFGGGRPITPATSAGCVPHFRYILASTMIILVSMI